ncbi:LysR family transcriptional regulator [Fulvivirga sp. 29W222]|uniref:LysR family transcriptional regulator n=1 Tax=Fulvivirga marina TaxID=2494733 RepID=A0A937FZY2_9BACT|nr:LysR substrate-binding domain-containing protein [Fulvivirga marina]MBL6447957.1 LysR family transcriptional regulator [Fulvivirga marina]
MELRQLRYFLKAKELLNFTEAASHLYISQSTLSQQIKQLEEELGVLLFERIGKRIKLTEAGELFSTYALQSINSANSGLQLLKDLNELNTGELKIGVTHGLRHLLTSALIEFSKRYPKITVQVTFGTSDELVEKLEKLELDFALSFQDVEMKKHFNYLLLFESPMCLVASNASPMTKRKDIQLNDIAPLPLVLPAKGFSTRHFLNNSVQDKHMSLNVAMEINDIPTLLELVKTGNHFTILAKTTVHDTKGVVTIPIKEKNMIRRGVAISMKEVYEKKATQEFYKVIQGLI